jgi:hypothetical protein
VDRASGRMDRADRQGRDRDAGGDHRPAVRPPVLVSAPAEVLAHRGRGRRARAHRRGVVGDGRGVRGDERRFTEGLVEQRFIDHLVDEAFTPSGGDASCAGCGCGRGSPPRVRDVRRAARFRGRGERRVCTGRVTAHHPRVSDRRAAPARRDPDPRAALDPRSARRSARVLARRADGRSARRRWSAPPGAITSPPAASTCAVCSPRRWSRAAATPAP